jgi:hypothetical protein
LFSQIVTKIAFAVQIKVIFTYLILDKVEIIAVRTGSLDELKEGGKNAYV